MYLFVLLGFHFLEPVVLSDSPVQFLSHHLGQMLGETVPINFFALDQNDLAWVSTIADATDTFVVCIFLQIVDYMAGVILA